MKKIVLNILLIMFLCPSMALAEVIPHTLYAISHEHLSRNDLNINQNISFQSIDRYEISDFDYVEKNAIVTVKIKEYIEPKRGKRNGYLKVQLMSYTIPSENNRIKDAQDLNIYGTLRLSTKKDKKEIAKSSGVSVAGHILKIPGFSQAVAVSKGLIKPNPEQNRLQSAGTNLYESTPLTLSEYGEDIKIEEDTVVVMRLKVKED